jgi:hypothetical protein
MQLLGEIMRAAMLCLVVAIVGTGYVIEDYSTNARNLSVAQSQLPQMSGYGERERTEAALGIMAFVLLMGSFVLFSQANDRAEIGTHKRDANVGIA